MTGSRVLLELDLTEPPLEAPPADVVGYLQARRRPTLRGVVDTLRDAAADDRVVGLVARVGGGGLPLARAQELRAAVRAFAATGKPAVAWAETLRRGRPRHGAVPAGHRIRRAVAAAVG